MEVPQLRGPVHLLQPVEEQGELVILQGSVQDEEWPPPQGRCDQGNLAGHLVLLVPAQDFLRRLLPDFIPRPGQEGLVVRYGALLSGELQVALEFAVQVAFQHVAGDLRGHATASGNDSGAVWLLLTSGARDNVPRGLYPMANCTGAWPRSWHAVARCPRWSRTLSCHSLPARRLDQQKNPG